MLKSKIRYLVPPLVLVLIILFLALRNNQSISDDDFEVDEPQVAVSTEIESTNISLSQDNQTEAPEDLAIINYAASPNEEKLVVLSKAENEENEGFDLLVYDVASNESEKIAADVIGVKFIDNSHIYYQSLEEKAVLRYNINKKKKDVMVRTTDSQSFYNIIPVTKDKFFFNQPTTGKLGFGMVGKGLNVILEEQLEISSNYVKKSAFSYASISKDKQTISIYNLNQKKSGKVQLYIIPVSTTKATQVKKHNVVFRAGVIENYLDSLWSSDSRYTAAGTDGTILDTKTNQTIKQSSDNQDKAIIFGSGEQYIELSTDIGEAVVKNINNDEVVEVEDQISSINWLDENRVVLSIGKRLYVFDVSASELLAVNENEAAFRIMQASSPSIWILEDGRIVRLNGQ